MKVKAWGITAFACVSLIASLAGIKYFEISSAMAYVNAMPEHSESVEAINPKVKEYAKSIQVLGNTVVPHHVTLQNEVAGMLIGENYAKKEKPFGSVVTTEQC